MSAYIILHNCYCSVKNEIKLSREGYHFTVGHKIMFFRKMTKVHGNINAKRNSQTLL
jgi:hypothetical protein